MYYVNIVLQLLPHNQWPCAKSTNTSTYSPVHLDLLRLTSASLSNHRSVTVLDDRRWSNEQRTKFLIILIRLFLFFQIVNFGMG